MNHYSNQDIQLTDVKDIVNNFSIYKPIEYSYKTLQFEVKYNNRLLCIQTPKVMICSLPREYKGVFKISLCFQNYKTNSIYNNFINKLTEIDNHFNKIKDKLSIGTQKYKKSKKWLPTIRFDDKRSIAYLELTIQSQDNNPILSVYDHNKKKREIEYISKYSNSLNIIYLKNVWETDLLMGLNWCIIQTKVFKPIIELDECIIIDEHEESPIHHYHNIGSIKKMPDESHHILGKYVKMRRLGVPLNIIEVKLKSENISIETFKRYINTGIFSEKNPEYMQNDSKDMKSLLRPDMLHSVKLKSVNIKEKKRVFTKKNLNRFAPTVDELQNIISKLRSASRN